MADLVLCDRCHRPARLDYVETPNSRGLRFVHQTWEDASACATASGRDTVYDYEPQKDTSRNEGDAK